MWPRGRRLGPALALRVALAGLSLAGPGCAGSGAAAASTAPAAVPDLPAAVRQVEQYLDGGRYAADVARVVAEAGAYLDERAPAVAKPAIVLDIDETALSNWTAYRVNGWARILNGPCDLERGPCGLRAWQALARAEALPPTLELVKRARARGVAVFFVSGRPAPL